MLETLLIFIFAVLASGLGTMIGFGGGVFIVPILVIALDIPIQFAVGSVALALFPAALISSIFNFRAGLIDFKTAVLLEAPTTLGAILGAYLTSLMPVQRLETLFGVFLLYFAFRISRSNKKDAPKSAIVASLNRLSPKFQFKKNGVSYQVGLWAAVLFGGSSGVAAGLFGIGGGFLKTPVMIKVFGMPIKLAVGTSLLTILFTSLSSSLSHASLGHLKMELAIPLVSGFALGAMIGNSLKSYWSDKRTEGLIVLGLFFAGVSILSHSLL